MRAGTLRPSLLLATPLIGLLAVPLIALAFGASPSELADGVSHPSFWPALWLSARTSLISLALVVVTGTPLAWWLASGEGRGRRVIEVLVDLPIVLPPAVVGIALLQTFGRSGLLGLGGWQIPFTTSAVILAQTVVSAPFFVQSAAGAFRQVDEDLLIVARTLGRSPTSAFFAVALPLARPGLIVGATLAWARALGEFGATLLFAGNQPGITQTMPLAVYAALESDVRVALALALVLAGGATLALAGLRLLPSLRSTRRP